MSGAGARLRFWGLLALSIVLLVGSVTLLVALLLPGLQSTAAAQTADGVRDFGVSAKPADVLGAGDVSMSAAGAAATVTPAAEWIVQPGGGGDLLVRSPDRVLEVAISVVDERAARVALDSAVAAADAREPDSVGGGANGGEASAGDGAGSAGDGSGAAGADAGIPGADAEAGARVALLTETLVSGAEVRHLTAGDYFIAVIETGGEWVLVEARVDAGHAFQPYRGTMSQLLESVDFESSSVTGS